MEVVAVTVISGPSTYKKTTLKIYTLKEVATLFKFIHHFFITLYS